MRDLLTGRQRVFAQALDGLFHDAQPPATIRVQAAQLGQDGQPLVEPGAFFCDGNYSLAINSWNSLAGVAVTIRVRWLTADGRTTDSDFTHTPNTNRTKATSVFPLGVGFALNVMAFASTASPLIGQTFLQVQLVRGLTGALLPVATLLQDYVTSVQAVAWPGSPIRSSIEGGGVVRQITGTTPGVGAEIAETVPTGARWKLLGLRSSLQSSGVAGNRIPLLKVSVAGATFGAALASLALAAGGSLSYSWMSGLGASTAAAAFYNTNGWSSELEALAGAVFGTQTTALDAGDQWGTVTYIVREYLEAAA